jgi:hypothetical protein
MPPDIPETAISYDHEQDLVHVYTTCQSVYSRLLARSTPPVRHRPLHPGYELLYKGVDCLDPSLLVR